MSNNFEEKCRELEKTIRVLQYENDLLSERAEETLLISLISDSIRAIDDRDGLMETVLEKISILKNIPYCAYCELKKNKAVQHHIYAAFSDMDFSGSPIVLSSAILNELNEGLVFITNGVTPEKGVTIEFKNCDFKPFSTYIFPFATKSIPNGLFVFMDDEPDETKFSAISMLLQNIIDMVVEKIDKITLLEELKQLNAELDLRIKIRTKSLVETNRQLAGEIMDRKRIEEALIASEKRFHQLFDEAPDSMIIIGMDDRILDANVAASNMLGYTREEFQAMTVADIQAPEVRGVVGTVMKNELTLGRTFEGVDIHKDGTIIPVGIHNHKMIINDQEIVLSIVRDMTGQKLYEEELKKREERYREYFEDDLSGTYISTPEGKLIACNQEYKRIFGFDSTKQALETSIFKLFETSEERRDHLNLIKQNKRVKNYTAKYKKIDGTPINVLENASGVFDDNGELTHIRGFLSDVTEQRKLEAKLLQSQKMEAIGTLAGGIAHDFNNILSGIFGYTYLASNDINNPEKVKKHLAQIEIGSQRAAELVRQILTFSRQSKYEKQPFNMYIAVKEALQFLRSSIPATVEIKESINSKAAVLADPIKIQQLILNLCTNAYHAMGESGGTMTISLNESKILKSMNLNEKTILPGMYLKLEVSDTGQGMDDKILKKAFDPYFTTKPVGQGTGLGLALVQAIVKEHEGFLEVHSRPDKGTRFYIYLPVFQKKIEPAALSTKKPVSINGNERIMIVDDEEAIRYISMEFLKNLGYTVSSFENGLEAFREFEKNPDNYDLIVTDMTMPKMTGDKMAIEMIKKRPDISIFLCTGFSETMSKEKAAAVGIKRLFTKPIAMKALAEEIRKVFDGNT